jgi:hypothetical protein
LLPITSFAERVFSSFPMHEDFNANDYNDIVWMTNGARHEWAAHAGWNGGGAAKIFPVTSEGYNALGQFHFPETEQLNARFLIRHGSAFNSNRLTYSKVIVMNRAGYRERPMIGGRYYEAGGWRTYGACDNTVCKYEGGDYWPDGTDSFRIGDPPNAREEEWICIEFAANSRTGLIQLYITTQDGVHSGLYVDKTMEHPGGTFSWIDVIGGYFNSGSTPGPNNYFMIDELVIDNKYIGPPEGFGVAAMSPPNPPTLQ